MTTDINNKLQKKKVGKKGDVNRAEYITLAVIKQKRCIKKQISAIMHEESF